MAHRSKWGWHPCDYETYRLLKALNRLCEQARRQCAAWHRWRRKLPHNRVLRRAVLDERGSKVGWEVAGPRPEPGLTPLFCARRRELTYWGEDGRPLREARPAETVALADHGVPEAYAAARRPAPTEEGVARLRLTPAEVRRLAAEAGLTG
jgi:hypothetical protein